MYYFLFILYSLVGYFLIVKSKLRKASMLSSRSFILVFLLKILMAVLVAFIFSNYQPGNDYLVFNQHGYLEYELLKANPASFFTNITDSFYSNKYGNFFSSVGSFWNDLRNNLVIKFVAILNIITAGNFYLNSLLFSLITFCGQLALYNFLKQVVEKNNTSVFIASFLLPSTIVFIAAVHKDGVIFTNLAFFSLALYAGFKTEFSFKKIVVLLFTFLLLFIMRSYVSLVVAAASIVFVLSFKLKFKPAYTLIVFVLGGWMSLFMLEKIAPDFKPLNLIVQKQTDFLAIPKAQTQIEITKLSPDILSLTKAAPEALSRAILQPNPIAFSNPAYLIFALENCLYLGLLILFFIVHKKNNYNHFNSSAVIYCLLIVALLFLFIGYTIPASGAIIRYKSIYLPYLIAFILAGINRNKIPIFKHIKF